MTPDVKEARARAGADQRLGRYAWFLRTLGDRGCRVQDCRVLDYDGLPRDIAVWRRARARGDAGNAFKDLHALDHPAEHAVAMAFPGRIAEIEKVIISDVDEELRGR